MPLNIPKSDSVCDISVVDTTTRFVVPAAAFVKPVAKGHEFMNMPSLAFIVRHQSSEKTFLFDLGCRKDWWSASPAVRGMIKGGLTAIQVSKTINQVLADGGLDDSKIDGIILSHGHFDHTGDLSLFSPSIDLWAGPGFVERNIPAYPQNPQALMLESDFRGRKVTEVQFDSSRKIGDFPFVDFFGDGSFFLLDAPGHYIGHMAGLARVTQDTFVLLAGDTCHFGGQLRPSRQVPMPVEIPVEVPLDAHLPRPCPASLFEAAHRNPRNRNSPFYEVSTEPCSFYENPQTAQASLQSLSAFDADENILVCIAHDAELRSVVKFFPEGTLNAWKQDDWKCKLRWTFVNDLPVDGKPGRDPVITGFVKDGRALTKQELEAL